MKGLQLFPAGLFNSVTAFVDDRSYNYFSLFLRTKKRILYKINNELKNDNLSFYFHF